MEFGAHLPLIDFRYGRFSLERLAGVTRAARDAGFSWLAAGDRLVFPAPWLDGPTALAAVLEHSGDLTLAITVALPVVRGPVALAKTVTALDVLSRGRVVVGVGPASAPDHEAAGLDVGDRRRRFEEAVPALRSLLGGCREPYRGRYYDLEGVAVEPRPARASGLALWLLAGDGSGQDLRRVARFADGWLASAVRTTPQRFARASASLTGALGEGGRPAHCLPNALADLFLYLTDHAGEAEHVLSEVLAPALRCPAGTLRGRVLVGSCGQAVDLLSRYERAGLDRALVWPVADEVNQLGLFAAEVAPSLR